MRKQGGNGSVFCRDNAEETSMYEYGDVRHHIVMNPFVWRAWSVVLRSLYPALEV